MIGREKMLTGYKYKKIPINETHNMFIIEHQHVVEVSDFVAKTYYNEDVTSYDCGLEEFVKRIEEEDEMRKDNATVFCIVDSEEELCCTATLLLRNKDFPVLPMEAAFHIDLDYFEEDYIYEFTRFASNGKISFYLIKKMLQCMCEYIEPDNSRFVAALNSKVYKKIKRIKYPAYCLGKSIHYMGAETTPAGIKISKLCKVVGL